MSLSNREITFRLRLPRTPRARWLVALVGFVVAAGAVAVAAPQAFVANEPLSAAKLNAAFADLDGRVARFETTWCGKTTITTGRLDNTNGFAAAAVLCRQVPGCRPNAHMCSTEELVRYATDGNTVTEAGWVSGGASATQCSGFTSESNNGATFGPGAQPSTYLCSSRLPVFCCH